MELRAPPRGKAAVVHPLAQLDAGVSDSYDALAKADRLHVVAVSSEIPTQAALVEQRIAETSVSVGRAP